MTRVVNWHSLVTPLGCGRDKFNNLLKIYQNIKIILQILNVVTEVPQGENI